MRAEGNEVVMPRDSCAFVKIKTPETNFFNPDVEEVIEEVITDEPVIESADIFEGSTEFSAAD